MQCIIINVCILWTTVIEKCCACSKPFICAMIDLRCAQWSVDETTKVLRWQISFNEKGRWSPPGTSVEIGCLICWQVRYDRSSFHIQTIQLQLCWAWESLARTEKYLLNTLVMYNLSRMEVSQWEASEGLRH